MMQIKQVARLISVSFAQVYDARVRAVKYIPRRLRLALLAAAVLVLVSTATRVALSVRPEVAVGGLSDWIHVFATGLAFDLVASCYLLSALVLWLALVP